MRMIYGIDETFPMRRDRSIELNEGAGDKYLDKIECSSAPPHACLLLTLMYDTCK